MDLEVVDEDAKYCSACLAVNVKMIRLQKSNLLEVFEGIINSEKKSQSIPQVFCYTCYALLRKCAQFHSICRQAQQLMNALKGNCIPTNSTYILNQPLNLKVSEIELVSYIPEDVDTKMVIEIKENDPEDVDTKMAIDIKEHDPIGFHQELQNDDFDTNFETAEEGEDPFDIKMSVEEVQTVDHDEIQVIDDPAICESDLDQPLAVVKTGLSRKTLTDPTKKKNLKKTVKSSTKSIKNKETQDQLKPVRKRKRKAKFNRYNEKFEKDFEEFCRTHNVEVVFFTKEQQIERKKVKYKDSKYYLHCEHCCSGFMTDTAYENHIKRHDPSAGTFVCEMCQLRYKDKARLQAHMRSHRKEFICKLCNKRLADSHSAGQHHRFHEGFKYECKYCKKKFNVYSSRFNHIQMKHMPARCDDCGESFEGLIQLRRHQNSMNCEPPSEHASDANIDATLPKTGSDLTACRQCGSRFENTSKLQAHIKRVHLGMKYGVNFVCEFCGKKCSSETLFKIHQRTHTGEKPFQCGFCSRRFTVKNQLDIHTRTHTGESPYCCNVCDKRFKQKGALNRHYVVHTGEKPYACTYCSKTFTQTNGVKLHINSVHLNIPQKRRNRRHKQHSADVTEQK